MYYIISSITNFITSLFVTILVLSINRKSALNKSFILFSASMTFWAFGYTFWQLSSSYDHAMFWIRFAMIGSIFIPPTFTEFAVLLVSQRSKFKLLLKLNWYIAFTLTLFSYSGWFIQSVRPIAGFEFWPKPSFLFYIFHIFFATNVIFSCILIFSAWKLSRGVSRSKLGYVLIALIIGFIGGMTNHPLWYGINIPPVGNITVSIYVSLITYAIIRYNLLDIKVAITRAGIFILVYTLVLGVPFYSAYILGLWKQSLWLMMILATTGPFIYLYLQKKAEQQLLQVQHQYQMTLQQASLGMGQIKELGRLLKLIVYIVTRAVGIEHSEIYLLHEDSNQFTLRASRGEWQDGQKQVSVIDADSPLVQHLKKIKESIVYEEIEQYAEDFNDQTFRDVADVIKQLDAGLVVPSFMDQKLIAILVLGKKKSGKLYTQDDLAVFSILGNQAGLAIENAQFYEKMRETHYQLLKAEKMATVGTMADGLSHQINNRLHAMGFIAGDALDTIRLKKKGKLSADMRALMEEIEHSLDRIEDNVKRGGEIVEGLLKYTRKGSEEFEAINLNKLLDASLEMAQYKIKLNAMNIERKFDDQIPDIKGNFTQLQEVFFNLVDNAYDAMMQRKDELKESEYQANLAILASPQNGKLEILIQDNGMGVKKENLEKLFTPFFTTKLSSKKGTGLGLYVIRQVIEENHGGKVQFTSEYKQGSQTHIVLPIAS